MKKILIISEYFAPINAIAAIRLTKLSKYFKILKGYDITVISRELMGDEKSDPVIASDGDYPDKNIKIKHSEFISYLYKLDRSRSSRIERDRIINDAVVSKMASPGFKKKIFIFVRYLFNRLINFDYQKNALKSLSKNDIMSFDIVLSSYGPVTSCLLAYKIKKINPNIKWIADFRDPMIRWDGDSHTNAYFKKVIEKVNANADYFTGVSAACFEGIFSDKAYENSKVICNGFDRADIEKINYNKTSDKFRLAYAGTLYEGMQDLTIIFKVLRELIDENLIDRNKVLVQYAGRESRYFDFFSCKYDLKDVAVDYGFVTRELALKLQLESSALILLSWNRKGSTGVITGKFLEYLMMEKPIICTVSGDLKNSVLKEMINEANCGIVFEEADYDKDYPELKNYILNQYRDFAKNEPLSYEPNINYIEKYNYKNIAKEFIDIIEHL